MPTPPASGEPEPEPIEDRLRRLERRLARVEAELGLQALEQQAATVPLPEVVRETRDLGRAVPLLGRALLVFGGAYLLRALTDAALLSRGLGIAFGLGYALLWLALSDRGVARGERLSAAFHGTTAVAIGLPLLWESALRFGLLPRAALAPAVGAFCLLTLALATRRNLASLAWAGMAGGTVAGLALVRLSPGTPAPVGLLAVLGVAAYWASRLRRWPLLPWMPAAAADLALAVVTFAVVSGRSGMAPSSAVALQLGFLAAFVGSFALRTLGGGKEVGAFEMAQGALAVLLGYRGALQVTRGAGLELAWLGAAGLAIATAAYVASFGTALRTERPRSFFYYTSLALVLVLLGSSVVLDAPALSLAWSALALACGVLSWRLRRVTLDLHGALYAGAAAGVSGLASAAASGLLAAPPEILPAAPPWAFPTLAAAVAYLLLPIARVSPAWGRFARLPGVLMLALAAAGLGGVIVLSLAPLSAAGEAADPGALAALRTVVLSVAAVALARLGLTERYREASWLVYPLLVGTGFKVVAEDFLRGRAATLFVALAALGAALIAVARLGRRPPAR
jgi:hypothetical protein